MLLHRFRGVTRKIYRTSARLSIHRSVFSASKYLLQNENTFQPSPPPEALQNVNNAFHVQPTTNESLEQLINDLEKAAAWNHGQPGKPYDATLWNPEYCRTICGRYDKIMEEISENPTAMTQTEKETLLSANTVILAFKTLLKCHYEPPELSKRVRRWERFLGQHKLTPLTDHLSLRLLTANGKAGNVGRVLSLLQLRKARGYSPRDREFVYAVTSIQAANHETRRSRNIFMSDREQDMTDNPTRWLDAILINMSERGYALTTALANQMLLTYSSGRTGKAVHHFYRIIRQPVSLLPEAERPLNTENMPKDWCYAPDINGYRYQPIKVKISYNRATPPFYKVPSLSKGKLLFKSDEQYGQFKLASELEPAFSIPLAAAFAFMDSLQHGACGHDPIELNAASYNALIKACVTRGALWRAMHIIDSQMPANNIVPNIHSYNLLFNGLAAVGDARTQQEYFQKLVNEGLWPNAFTVRAIVDGLLNLGDMAGAITFVQDVFNQFSVLPPYPSHIKIIEFCLATDLVHEAKRHVYFIQQLWHWTPNQYHSPEFVKLMRATQQNTQLHRPALQKLFSYFGEELTDNDFL